MRFFSSDMNIAHEATVTRGAADVSLSDIIGALHSAL
jgi:hypothetical protein